MKLLLSITPCGSASVVDGGLRCGNIRTQNNRPRVCNALLLKLNPLGQAAGDIKCKRCGQQLTVSLVAPST